MSQESSSDSSRRRLEDVLKKSSDKKDVIAAAYELAEEDPRSTLEIIETRIDELFDEDDNESRDLLSKLGKHRTPPKNES